MNKIQKALRIGDVIYSATGKEQIVTQIDGLGFFCGDEYYLYDEHRTLYYLTERGLHEAKRQRDLRTSNGV